MIRAAWLALYKDLTPYSFVGIPQYRSANERTQRNKYPIRRTNRKIPELSKYPGLLLTLDDKAMGYTLKTLAAALWCLHHCNSFEEGLFAMIDAGGDADTNAAVACSLLVRSMGINFYPPYIH